MVQYHKKLPKHLNSQQSSHKIWVSMQSSNNTVYLDCFVMEDGTTAGAGASDI